MALGQVADGPLLAEYSVKGPISTIRLKQVEELAEPLQMHQARRETSDAVSPCRREL